MDIITGVIDTNLEICYNLDYLSILNLKETCQYFYKILQNNGFWKNYIYNELKKHYIDLLRLEKYRPSNELYYISYRNYYTTKSIKHAIKENRLDSIIFLKVYGANPCMWDTQKTCEIGNVNALEFFYNEYNLLPTDIHLSIKPKKLSDKPKRRKDPKKTYMERLSGTTGPRGALGPKGCVGPVGPVGPIGPVGYINGPPPPPDPYAIIIAIKHDHDKILDWLYYKNIKPTQSSVNTIGRMYNKSYRWFKNMNKKDNLGLII